MITDSAFPTGSTMYEGMSLLDYFAAEAMKFVQNQYPHRNLEHWKENVTRASYDMADAMMAERKRRSEVKE